MELFQDNGLMDNSLDLGDSDNDDLLGGVGLFDQYLDDGSWFLLLLGNSNLNRNFLQDQFSSDNSNNLSSDDDQFFVFSLLSVNGNLKMFDDLFNHLLSLLNFHCQFSDDGD